MVGAAGVGPSTYRRLRLFDEQPDALLRISRLERQADGAEGLMCSSGIY
jgi:hypothetical protein